MKLEEMDNIDRKILAELDKDARISYSELGKRIRVAKETVKYRIAQLEQKGVITGYYTVLNFSKLGFTVYRLYLRLQNASPEIEQKLVRYLTNAKNVPVLYRINGPYHLVLGIWARDIWEYEQFWSGLKKEFGRYVADCHLAEMTEYLEYSREYLAPKQVDEQKQVFTTISRAERRSLDNLDFKLIGFLSNNARASLVAIANALDVSMVTARGRLKKLVNARVIVGYRAILDLNMIGQEYYKVDIWLNNFSRLDEIARFVKNLPNVTYSEKTIVTSDIEFDLEVTGFDGFIRTMDGIKERFPEDIRDYKYYSRISALKVSYAPEILPSEAPEKIYKGSLRLRTGEKWNL